MKAEIKDEFSSLEKFTVRFIKKKFGTLASNCEYRFLDSKGLPNCAYHSSAIGYCQCEICPRLRDKQSEGGDANEVKRKEDKVIERIKQWR